MKHISALLVVFAFLLIPEIAFCEFHIDAKLGYFIPSSSAMMDIYGGSKIPGADIYFWEDKWGLSFGIDSFTKEGTPYVYGTSIPSGYSASSEITRTNVSITGLYRFGNPKESYPYVGFGIDSAQFDEKLTVKYQGTINVVEASVNGTGSHIVAGIDIRTSETASIFFEFIYSSIPFNGAQGAAGSNADGGGVTLYGGIRF